jgi:hypothetical protein
VARVPSVERGRKERVLDQHVAHNLGLIPEQWSIPRKKRSTLIPTTQLGMHRNLSRVDVRFGDVFRHLKLTSATSTSTSTHAI